MSKLGIIDTTAPEGYEIMEVSAAKDAVADRFYEEKWDVDPSEEDADQAPYGIDVIAAADDIVETLIKAGWRPTVDTEARA